MLQQAANKVMGRTAQARIPIFIIKQGLPILEEQHMDMHAAARFLVNRLGQERGRLPLLGCHVLDNIFDNHCIIRHIRHVGELHLNLHLPRPTDLMMMVLYWDPPVLNHHADFAAQAVSHVKRSGDMVAAVIGHLEAVIPWGIQAAVPFCLPGVNPVAALLGRHLKTGAVK